MPEFYGEFGSRLRHHRERAKLSQQEVADRVGLTRASIANIEAGRQRVALHLFADLAETLDVNPMALLPERTPVVDDELLETSLQHIFREIPRRWVGESGVQRR
jgi:transcriptional regulator with XRE-family HTH domain